MKSNKTRIILLSGVIFTILLVTFVVVKQPDSQAAANKTVKLQAPQFVGIAKAEANEILSFMEDEAGIACYFEALSGIDLNDVRDAFRTIEVETADYILGSVPVTNYPESEDVHVYVHTNGWVVAYYLAADPAGKIYDWRVYHDNGRTVLTTKLDNTLALMALEAGVPFASGSGTYYDFRNPNATHMMLIAEWTLNTTDEFEVNLPGSFDYYELSWSLGGDGNQGTFYFLDDIQISYVGGWETAQGLFTESQLFPDQFHTIGINSGTFGYGGLAIVYREYQVP